MRASPSRSGCWSTRRSRAGWAASSWCVRTEARLCLPAAEALEACERLLVVLVRIAGDLEDLEEQAPDPLGVVVLGDVALQVLVLGDLVDPLLPRGDLLALGVER